MAYPELLVKVAAVRLCASEHDGIGTNPGLAFQRGLTSNIPQGLLDKFPLEEVVPVRPEMIEDCLEVFDIPRFWEL